MKWFKLALTIPACGGIGLTVLAAFQLLVQGVYLAAAGLAVTALLAICDMVRWMEAA